MNLEKHDVVIVGAGLAGLSAAVFLALNGVRPLVLERNASTSVLPKARGQNPITMEALRDAGLADAVHAARPAGKPGITSVVSESMTGKVLYDHVANRPDFSRFSPELPGLASQARAEAALHRRALELGVEVRFDCACEQVSEHADHVALEGRRGAAGEPFALHAQYVIAADGVRGTVASQLGIGSHGIGHLKSVTAVRFDADLSRWLPGTAMTIHYVKNAALPDGSGILVSTDDPGRWVANFSADPARDTETTKGLILTLLGLDQLDFEITGDTTYHYTHRVADRMSSRRVFLAGDAAHVMPPTGGQGGNTALQDGYYLGWKLALVVRGIAGARLLETYDTERRPYAEIVCTWQAANLAERRDMKNLGAVLGEPIDHATMMFGYVCADGAFVGDLAGDSVGAIVTAKEDPPPAAAEPFEDPAQPTGRPGARVPYTTLARAADGTTLCTRSSVGQRFCVYTADPALAAAAERMASDLGLAQTVAVVRETSPLKCRAGDSVLVRPDGIVAWRGRSTQALASAYEHVLARA